MTTFEYDERKFGSLESMLSERQIALDIDMAMSLIPNE
jgi:hypothetical protein